MADKMTNSRLMKQRELRDRKAARLTTAPDAQTPTGSPDPLNVQPDPEQTEALLNINTATLAEIIALPHLGDITAGRVETNRPYADLAEFKTKSGVTLSKAQWQELSALISF